MTSVHHPELSDDQDKVKVMLTIQHRLLNQNSWKTKSFGVNIYCSTDKKFLDLSYTYHLFKLF